MHQPFSAMAPKLICCHSKEFTRKLFGAMVHTYPRKAFCKGKHQGPVSPSRPLGNGQHSKKDWHPGSTCPIYSSPLIVQSHRTRPDLPRQGSINTQAAELLREGWENLVTRRSQGRGPARIEGPPCWAEAKLREPESPHS